MTRKQLNLQSLVHLQLHVCLRYTIHTHIHAYIHTYIHTKTHKYNEVAKNKQTTTTKQIYA